MEQLYTHLAVVMADSIDSEQADKPFDFRVANLRNRPAVLRKHQIIFIADPVPRLAISCKIHDKDIFSYSIRVIEIHDIKKVDTDSLHLENWGDELTNHTKCLLEWVTRRLCDDTCMNLDACTQKAEYPSSKDHGIAQEAM